VIKNKASRKLCIAIIGGAMETSLHPIPPVADGAPEWNVFRLVEAVPDLNIRVISPCADTQMAAIKAFPVQGNYSQVVFSTRRLRFYRAFLRHIFPLRLAVRRLSGLPDLFSWWYLRKVKIWLKETQPDLVFINARPQYIRYLRKLVPAGNLFLMMRGPLGESRRFLPLLDGIVVNSEGMRVYVGQFLNANNIPIWIIPNTLGDDFPIYPSSSDRFTCSPRMIIFSGRIIPEKGVLELLEAFDLVRKIFPGVELTICGARSNQSTTGKLSKYEQQVVNWVDARGFGAVHLVGYIPTIRIGEYYGRATLAVFPSRNDIYTESFGMVALEAMRCGTPVVASSQPGFEELVLPGKTGYLVKDPRNAAELAETILNILQNPALAQSLGQAGYLQSLKYNPTNALLALKNNTQKWMLEGGD